MIKIAVCDDEKQVRLRLLTIIQQYFSEIKREVWVAGFKRGQELLSAKVRFDIIFLDIEMPELNGIETAKKLRKWDVKRKLYINENRVNLTRKEFDIFYYLFQKKGDVVSHKELYERVWKQEYIHDDMNIMAHIHRLRGKIEKDPKNPRYICNQYGVGYYFCNMLQK